MSMSFLQLSNHVMIHTKQPMSGVEIWEKAKELKIDHLVETKGKTPERTIGAQLGVVSDPKKRKKHNRKNTFGFIRVNDTKPYKYYLKSLVPKKDEQEEIDIEEKEATLMQLKTSFQQKLDYLKNEVTSINQAITALTQRSKHLEDDISVLCKEFLEQIVIMGKRIDAKRK